MIDKACLKEKVIHGKKNFPIGVYRNICEKQNILEYHWHNESEFIYLVSGEAIFYADAVPFQMKPGEALFIQSGQIHSGYMDHPGKCKFYSVVFDIAMLDGDFLGESRDAFINPLIANRYSLPKVYKPDDEKYGKYVLKKLSTLIKAYYDKAPAYELIVVSSLYSIISRIAACNSFELETRIPGEWDIYKKERFKHVLEYIHTNYKRRLTVEDMARQVCLSPFHFSRFFKSISGKTPVEYLNEYRIDQASHLLICSSDKIMDVAFECGFLNFSYFIKLFRKYKGCTPSDYRKNFCVSHQKGNII